MYKYHDFLRTELVEVQITTALNPKLETKKPTLGKLPIVQIVEPTISKMETVQKNQSYKDSVCSILEHTDKNKQANTKQRAELDLRIQRPERVLSYVEGSVTRPEHRRKVVLRVEPVETQITSVQILKNISNLKKKWEKGGGCPFDKLRAQPSTSSGTVLRRGSGTARLNSIFCGFGNGVFANG